MILDQMSFTKITDFWLYETKFEWKFDELFGNEKFLTPNEFKYFKELLFNNYTNSHLKYHNICHVMIMIELLEYLISPGNPWNNYCTKKELKLLKIAILFHDVIYIPGASHNEEMSAETARVFLEKLEYSSDDINVVLDLIYQTKVFLHHQVNIVEGDLSNLIHDLDFMGFAYDYEIFKKLQKNIISEQSILNRDLKWFQKHWYSYLLKNIKDGKVRLYCTTYCQEEWEPKAIKNLKKIIKEKSLDEN